MRRRKRVHHEAIHPDCPAVPWKPRSVCACATLRDERSAAGVAAVDDRLAAGHELRFIGCRIHQTACDVVGFAHVVLRVQRVGVAALLLQVASPPWLS